MTDSQGPRYAGSPQVPHGARHHHGRRRARAPADAPPTGSRSWCPTWSSRRTRSPAWRPGTPAPAPNATRAAACTCAPARGARSSWRATPSTRQPGQALLPRPGGAAGAVQPGPGPGPMARGGTGAWRRSPGTTPSAAWPASWARRETGWRCSPRRARGSFTDFLTDWTGALGGKLVRYETFDHEPLRAANRQVFGLDQIPRTTSPRPDTSSRSGPTSWRAGAASIENQRGFARSHGFTDGEVAKFVYAAPRMDLTGLNADEWLPIRPGSEAALALAMANVLLAGESDAPAGLASALGPYTPAMAAAETGVPAERIERLAREFAAARPSLAVAGGVGAQHAAATEVCAAVNVLNFVAGNVGETVRFGADLPMADGQAGWPAWRRRSTGARSRCCWCTAPTRSTPCPRRAPSPTASARWPTRWPSASISTRPRRECDLVLPEQHALERWDDLRPRAGVYGLMQPVMEPVVRCAQRGRHPAPGEQEGRRRPGPLRRAELGGPPQDPLAGAGGRAGREAMPPASGTRRCSTAASSARRPRRRAVSLSLREARMSYTKPSFEGDGRFRLPDLSPRPAARRAGRQQAVAAGERRPGHQDHLALLGRGGPRGGAPSSTCATGRSSSSPRLMAARGAGVRLSRASATMPWRCRWAWDTPPTGPSPRTGASTRSTCSARRAATSCPTSRPG